MMEWKEKDLFASSQGELADLLLRMGAEFILDIRGISFISDTRQFKAKVFIKRK